MFSVEEVTENKKVKAKEAKPKKSAVAKSGKKGKGAPVRTSGRKVKISKDLGLDLGEIEEEVEFPPSGGMNPARSDQIRLIRQRSAAEDARLEAIDYEETDTTTELRAEKESSSIKAKEQYDAMYAEYTKRATLPEKEEYDGMEGELSYEMSERVVHRSAIAKVEAEIERAKAETPPRDTSMFENYRDSLYELVTCRNREISRILQSDLVMNSPPTEEEGREMTVISSKPTGSKGKSDLPDLSAHGEEEYSRSDQEEEEVEAVGSQTGNRTKASEEN